MALRHDNINDGDTFIFKKIFSQSLLVWLWVVL